MVEPEWLDDMVCFVDLAEIKSAMIHAVAKAWQAIVGNRDFPRRGELDPIFKNWGPNLSLVDIRADPFRVYYRRVGAEVARFAEEDFSDVWLDESGWDPKIIAVNRMLYERLWQSRRPSYGFSLVDLGQPEKYSFEWAMFPLSEDGVQVDCSLSVDDFTPLARGAHPPR
jgi:hypothetical protein